MTDRREAVRGITVQGLGHEFVNWHREHRPDLPWPVAWRAWLDVIGGLPPEVDREVRSEIQRLRRRP